MSLTDFSVVLLPGGKATSAQVSRPWQLANLRMMWLQIALRGRLPGTVEIRRVRYRVRGWNGGREDPVHDAATMLDGAQRVILVGHSMGGRVAARLAARPEVTGVVALAPWWPAGEGDRIERRTRLVVLHGTADTWTDPEASRRQVERAVARGVDARWIPMAGGHFMIRRVLSWHRLTAEAVSAMLDGSALDR